MRIIKYANEIEYHLVINTRWEKKKESLKKYRIKEFKITKGRPSENKDTAL